MSPLELAAPVGEVVGHAQVARWIAAICFVALLSGLGLGLMRARKQLRHDEAEASLEADFRRLERELASDDAPARAELRGGEGS